MHGLGPGKDGGKDHPYKNCSGKQLDNILSSKYSLHTSNTVFKMSGQDPDLFKIFFPETDTYSLYKWKKVFLKDIEITINSHSIVKKKLAHQYHLLTDHTMHISGVTVSPIHYAGVHWPTAYSACSHEPLKQTQVSSLNHMLWNTAGFSSETS